MRKYFWFGQVIFIGVWLMIGWGAGAIAIAGETWQEGICLIGSIRS